ncbi:hypothetical protein ITJ64_01625 [Herbiconiux sp. VKM Ac-1786]|uniref:hypothetical protein n=1 Tax=Herbiconiux sp. VKM Ac-1786 TaxID=2783824 RepID=UPI00188B7D93|nr:hypothetical protein [Herbiconiux sp. VKM Ac-1786]MBF4571210.1 hypothetical protein [Herbiconiux sp. VKM Ac-1786]
MTPLPTGAVRPAALALGLVAMAVASVVVLAAAPSRAEAPTAAATITGSAAATTAADGSAVALAPLLATWPDAYRVTGTKSEPLYVEHITSTRTGDDYALTIDVVAQGNSPLGVQSSSVHLDADGTVRWVDGCTKAPERCADDPGLRGFLSQAALLAAERRGGLPEWGVARTLHGHPVVCVSDAGLHPLDPPTVVTLDPCFSTATGALLGHWSSDSDAFVGPTLAEGLVDEAR